MKRIITFFTLFFLCISLFAIEAGDSAPVFANRGLDNRFHYSKNYVGSSWLLVDFFATDCVPCKEELPELEQIYSEFSEKGLKALVFATDTAGMSIVKPFFEETPTTITVVIDNYKVTAERYGVKEIPTVFLVNPDGEVVFRGDGYSIENIEEMRAILGAEPDSTDS